MHSVATPRLSAATSAKVRALRRWYPDTPENVIEALRTSRSHYPVIVCKLRARGIRETRLAPPQGGAA